MQGITLNSSLIADADQEGPPSPNRKVQIVRDASLESFDRLANASPPIHR